MFSNIINMSLVKDSTFYDARESVSNYGKVVCKIGHKQLFIMAADGKRSGQINFLIYNGALFYICQMWASLFRP